MKKVSETKETLKEKKAIKVPFCCENTSSFAGDINFKLNNLNTFN